MNATVVLLMKISSEDALIILGIGIAIGFLIGALFNPFYHDEDSQG